MMIYSVLTKTKSILTDYRRVFLPVLVALGIVAVVIIVLFKYEGWSVGVDTSLATSTELSITGPVMDESLPTKLRIPSVNIDTLFSAPLGLEPSGEVMVPEGYDEVGLYRNGPTPGELGPAVVLGHVDSVDGPAVFFSLGQLKEGDDIYVDRVDGTTAHFKVTELRRIKQSDFPTRDVYGDLDHAGLRLITCTGIFNQGAQRYSHNLIVFAKAVE